MWGVDNSETQVRLREQAMFGDPVVPDPEGSHHQSRLSPNTADGNIGGEDAPEHRPLQQTFTWRQTYTDPESPQWHRERSHMRLVVNEVGRPITQFLTTRELIMAVRDAIIGESHLHTHCSCAS